MNQFLIGIDDTDNLESRGTGHLARNLGISLQEAGLGVLRGITRHQLLVHPEIRYTSHNSSACLVFEAKEAARAKIIDLARSFLVRESAAGADVGLSVAASGQAGTDVQSWGQRARREVLKTDTALELAKRFAILLEGLTGDGGGVIGALAAVGLRAAGNDGRFLWLPNLRELKGIHLAQELCEKCKIDAIETVTGVKMEPAATVDVGPWPRPILRGGRSILLVEECNDEAQWRVVAKDYIKSITE